MGSEIRTRTLHIEFEDRLLAYRMCESMLTKLILNPPLDVSHFDKLAEIEMICKGMPIKFHPLSLCHMLTIAINAISKSNERIYGLKDYIEDQVYFFLFDVFPELKSMFPKDFIRYIPNSIQYPFHTNNTKGWTYRRRFIRKYLREVKSL